MKLTGIMSLIGGLNSPYKKPDTKVITQSYQAQTSRVHKGKIAPSGSIYLVVRYIKWVAHALVVTKGLTETRKAEIYDMLFKKIKETYKV